MLNLLLQRLVWYGKNYLVGLVPASRFISAENIDECPDLVEEFNNSLEMHKKFGLKVEMAGRGTFVKCGAFIYTSSGRTVYLKIIPIGGVFGVYMENTERKISGKWEYQKNNLPDLTLIVTCRKLEEEVARNRIWIVRLSGIEILFMGGAMRVIGLSIIHNFSAPLGYYFQNAAWVVSERVTVFHDWLIVILISIACGVLWSLLIVQKSLTVTNRLSTESQSLEAFWTLSPTFVLGTIGLPSLRLLYEVDEGGVATLTVKAQGHQWYWHYDYPDIPSYDSYIIIRDYRLLDTDHRLYCPLESLQILITSADVLHSWAVPALSVKADAVPGRVNKLSFCLERSGVYFGQCSEICGSNHSFIPIAVERILFNQSQLLWK